MRIGDVDIDPVFDGLLTYDPAFTHPDVDRATLAHIPGALTADGQMQFPYGGFLLRGPGEQVVLYDLGTGPQFPTVPGIGFRVVQQGRLPSSLQALGVGVYDVTDVVYSHLHLDHVGWAPGFRHARHHIHALDWQRFVETDSGDSFALGTRELLKPLEETVQLWDGAEHHVTPWLRLEPAAGHTPGSVVGLVESQGDTGLMIGDLVHSPIEIDRPEMRLPIDVDPDAAAEHRKQWVGLAIGTRAAVFAPHFPDMAPVRLGSRCITENP